MPEAQPAKNAENASRAAVELPLAREVERSARTGSWALRLSDGTVHWSEEMHRIYGTDPGSFTPTRETVAAFLHREDLELLMEQAERWRSSPGPFAFVYRIVRSDGSLRHVEARGWVRDGEASASGWVLGTAHDITEKVREEVERAELAQSREQLLSELTTAEERERERIAGDIHDDTVQALDAVSLRLERLLLDESRAQRREQIEDVLGDVQAAAVRLRTLTFQLLPPASEGQLRELLEADLAATLDERELRWTLSCEPCFLDRDQKLLVLRFVREAARNVVKHAFAGEVSVRVKRSALGLRVEVEDDGVGIPHGAPDPMHAGLRLMRDRLGAAGGRMELSAVPNGNGVIVVAELPARGRPGL